jgi:hypothetical protein
MSASVSLIAGAVSMKGLGQLLPDGKVVRTWSGGTWVMPVHAGIVRSLLPATVGSAA